MTLNITLEGSKAMQDALRNASDEMREATRKAVIGTALELESDIKDSIKKPGTGTIYYRIYDAETGYTTIFAGDSEGYVKSIKGKLNLSATHRASADGMPPATDTGRLLNSIRFNVIGELTANVETNLDYAYYLEYGTISMNARPFFRPAVERIRPKFVQRLERALSGALR